MTSTLSIPVRPSGRRPADFRLLGFGESMGALRCHATTTHVAISLLSSRSSGGTGEIHAHDCADFLLPLDPGFQSDADGYDHTRAGQQIIFTPPGVAHCDNMQRLGGRFVTISVSSAQRASVVGELALVRRSVATGDPLALHTAHTLAASLAAPLPVKARIEALANELLALVALGRRSSMPDFVDQALSWMHGSPASVRLAVGDIAQQAGVHPVYFARAFRRAAGCSPRQYLLRQRVMRAAERLRCSRVELAQVAYDTGFCDQAHLARGFQSVFGATPTAYREAFQ